MDSVSAVIDGSTRIDSVQSGLIDGVDIIAIAIGEGLEVVAYVSPKVTTSAMWLSSEHDLVVWEVLILPHALATPMRPTIGGEQTPSGAPASYGPPSPQTQCYT